VRNCALNCVPLALTVTCFATELGPPAVAAGGSPESIRQVVGACPNDQDDAVCRAPPSVRKAESSSVMLHWSVTDELGSPAAPDLAPAKPVAAERGPVERIAEIFEKLFFHEPGLMGELPGELCPHAAQLAAARFDRLPQRLRIGFQIRDLVCRAYIGCRVSSWSCSSIRNRRSPTMLRLEH
jgi:hypothetical protein